MGSMPLAAACTGAVTAIGNNNMTANATAFNHTIFFIKNYLLTFNWFLSIY